MLRISQEHDLRLPIYVCCPSQSGLATHKEIQEVTWKDNYEAHCKITFEQGKEKFGNSLKTGIFLGELRGVLQVRFAS